MTTYKYMLLDHRNHLIEVKRCEFEADDIACEYSRTLYGQLHPSSIEVWQGPRLICSVSADGLRLAA